MKNSIIIFLFGICFSGAAVMAQIPEPGYGADRDKILESDSVYSEFMQRKNYKEAYPAWKYVFLNAPSSQESIYVNGRTLLVNMYLQTRNEAYVDTLMTLYDRWIKYFGDTPGFSEGAILGMKGEDLYRYGSGSSDDKKLKEVYGYLAKSFEAQGAKTSTGVAQVLFLAAGDLAKKNIITKEEYLDLYSGLITYAKNGVKNAPNPKIFADLKLILNQMLFNSGMADCAFLNKFLTTEYEAAPDDEANLKEIYSMLYRNECRDLLLFETVSEQLYRLEPTAESAYNMAVLYRNRRDTDKYEYYLNEAIQKADDPSVEADYYLEMAHLKLSRGLLRETKSNVLEVLKRKVDSGSALILLGKAYAGYSKSYGQDSFDNGSVYWVAVDKFIKAKQVDPGVASEADHLITTYSAHFPSKEDAFFRSINPGNTVRIGDWINETTTARFRR